jgi:hypothetical protein
VAGHSSRTTSRASVSGEGAGGGVAALGPSTERIAGAGERAAPLALPGQWHATPGGGGASSRWHGGRLPTPAGPHPAGTASCHPAVAPLETLRQSPGRTPPGSRRAPDARVCPTARPTPEPGRAAAAPRRAHWPARLRQTRRLAGPVHAPRRAWPGRAPAADRRWPGSPRLPAPRSPLTAVERHGGRPASGERGAWTARSRRRRGASGTCPPVRHGSARPTRGGQSGAGPAPTPQPSPGPTTAECARSRLRG